MNDDMILYNTDNSKTKREFHLKDRRWFTQLETAELLQTSKQHISKHVKAIFSDREPDKKATVNCQLTVQNEGSREISRKADRKCKKYQANHHKITSVDENYYKTLNQNIKRLAENDDERK